MAAPCAEGWGSRLDGHGSGSRPPRTERYACAGRPCDDRAPRRTKALSMIRRLCAALVFLVWLAAPAAAAKCGGDFNAFIAAMARDAAAAGVSRGVIDQAFAGIAIDQTVLTFDRRQRGTFPRASRITRVAA